MNELRNADEQLKKYEHDIENLKREIGACGSVSEISNGEKI